MNCREKKELKYLDDEGLLFFTQAIYNGIERQIASAISKAVVEQTLASNPQIIEKINEMLEEGDLATKQALNASVRQLKDAIEQAKDDAVTDAIAKFNANVKVLAKKYAQEAIDEYEQEGIDVEELAAMLLADAEFKAMFVKKSGDTMSGALTVNGNITGEKFVTSSGIVFF